MSPPFKEFLVYPEAGFKKKAEYIEKINSPPDWGIVFDPPALGSDQPPPDDQSSTYSLLTEFQRLKCSNIGKKLDVTQLEAVELALENKLTLIQVHLHSAGNYFSYIVGHECVLDILPIWLDIIIYNVDFFTDATLFRFFLIQT